MQRTGKRKLVLVAIGFMVAGIFLALVSSSKQMMVQYWRQPGVLYEADGSVTMNHVLRPPSEVIDRDETKCTIYGIASIIFIVAGIGFMVHALVPERWKFKKNE
ncbi:MAG: hypothetical protein NTY53_20830 [Kiritimatiellaeota bacterium]|nr:hypothetical protein [Kiritimatiellota bacterium]